MSPSKEPCVVVVWGDSIAASGWPQQMEFAFNVSQNTGRAIKVINAGIGGMPASRARTQFEERIAPHKPEVVIIQFGFNDMRHDGTRGALPLSTPDEFKEHITHMIHRCQHELKAKVLVFGNHRVNRVTVLPTGLKYDTSRAVYTARAAEAAAENDAIFLDMAQLLDREAMPWPTLVSDDGVHLSGSGLKAYTSIASTAIMWLLAGQNPEEEFRRSL